MVDKTIYLAGPISGKTYDEATGWRYEVKASLASVGIKCLSPMRAETFLSDHKGPLNSCQTIDELIACGSSAPAISTPRGITTRDRFDALNCDVLFVNLLDTDVVSIGTVMEIAWADAMRTPVVLIMKKGNIHDHPMVQESVGFRVNTVQEGIEIVRSILGDY